MRVSTTFIHQQGVQNMLQQQSRLVGTQQQLASGKRINVPSDDPVGASRVIDLDEAISQLAQHEENGGYAMQRLGMEETTLNSVLNVLQRARELAVQGGNLGALDLAGRQAVAQELREKLDEVFDYANTRDANGEYLFSGFQSGTQAFSTDGMGNYTYNGDLGQLALQIGNNRQVITNDSGADVFQLIRNGNGTFVTDVAATNTGSGRITTGSVQNPATYLPQDFTIRFTSATTFEVDNVTTGATNIIGAQTYAEGAAINFNGVEVVINGTPATADTFSVNASRNQDLFSMINNLIVDIETSPQSAAGNAQYLQGVANALNNIDRAMENIENVRTHIGGRMNAVESQADDNAAKKLQFTRVRSQVRDLDYAEAISKLTFQTTALQVAQQTFSKVQNLSLFNFI